LNGGTFGWTGRCRASNSGHQARSPAATTWCRCTARSSPNSSPTNRRERSRPTPCFESCRAWGCCGGSCFVSARYVGRASGLAGSGYSLKRVARSGGAHRLSLIRMRRDLALAGIEYGDDEIGFADLHSARKSLNAMLANHRVDGRARQVQLRHTNPRLTEGTYFDQGIFIAPQAEQINSVPAIRGGASTPSRSDERHPNGAQLAHNGRGSLGQNGALAGTKGVGEAAVTGRGSGASDTQLEAGFGTNGHGPASCDAGPCRKRAKGIEPSTFTLATSSAGVVSAEQDQALTAHEEGPRRISAGSHGHATTTEESDRLLPELHRLWPQLTDAVRTALLALARSAQQSRPR
jgi:hypothetical protein